MSELNLLQKLVEIRKSIDVFKKDTEGYGYSYVSGSQILRKIKDKMDEHQVLLIPHIGDMQDTTYDYQVWDKENSKLKDKTDFVVKGDMHYEWINAENPEETIKIPWKIYGQQDDISKAYGTALTYSERYFLLKFFGVPTDEEDPDARPTNNRGKGSQKASDKQLNFINTLIEKVSNKHGVGVSEVYDKLKGTLKTENELENFTSQEASAAIKLLQEWQKKKKGA